MEINLFYDYQCAGTVTDLKCYVLKSSLPDELRTKFVDTPEDAVTASLTLLIVSIISLCGEKVPEGLDLLILNMCISVWICID